MLHRQGQPTSAVFPHFSNLLDVTTRKRELGVADPFVSLADLQSSELAKILIAVARTHDDSKMTGTAPVKIDAIIKSLHHPYWTWWRGESAPAPVD
jgi:hypothetical protein